MFLRLKLTVAIKSNNIKAVNRLIDHHEIKISLLDELPIIDNEAMRIIMTKLDMFTLDYLNSYIHKNNFNIVSIIIKNIKHQYKEIELFKLVLGAEELYKFIPVIFDSKNINHRLYGDTIYHIMIKQNIKIDANIINSLKNLNFNFNSTDRNDFSILYLSIINNVILNVDNLNICIDTIGYINEYKEYDILEIYNLNFPIEKETIFSNIYIIGNPLNYVFYISIFLGKYLRNDIYYIPFLSHNDINIFKIMGNTKLCIKNTKNLINFNLTMEKNLMDMVGIYLSNKKNPFTYKVLDTFSTLRVQINKFEISCGICRTKSYKSEVRYIKSYKNKCCICLTNFSEVILGCGCGTYCKNCEIALLLN